MFKKNPNYTDVIELDLSTVEASLSGPKRPQDLIFLSDMKSSFENSVRTATTPSADGLDKVKLIRKLKLTLKMDQRLQ